MIRWRHLCWHLLRPWTRLPRIQRWWRRLTRSRDREHLIRKIEVEMIGNTNQRWKEAKQDQRTDVTGVKELLFPLDKLVSGRFEVEKHDLRVTWLNNSSLFRRTWRGFLSLRLLPFYKPVAIDDADATCTHGCYGRSQGSNIGLSNFNFCSNARFVQRSHRDIIVAKLALCRRHFAANDRVDATDLK